MPESPSTPDPARPRSRRHIMWWCLGIFALTGAGAVVVWAPPERAMLLMMLASVVVTGLVGWWSSTRRR